MKRIEERPWKEIVDVRKMTKARAKLGEFSELLHELDGLLERLIEILEEERAAAKGATPKKSG